MYQLVYRVREAELVTCSLFSALLIFKRTFLSMFSLTECFERLSKVMSYNVRQKTPEKLNPCQTTSKLLYVQETLPFSSAVLLKL